MQLDHMHINSLLHVYTCKALASAQPQGFVNRNLAPPLFLALLLCAHDAFT